MWRFTLYGEVAHSRWKPRQMLSPHQPMVSTRSGSPSSFSSTNSLPAGTVNISTTAHIRHRTQLLQYRPAVWEHAAVCCHAHAMQDAHDPHSRSQENDRYMIYSWVAAKLLTDRAMQGASVGWDTPL